MVFWALLVVFCGAFQHSYAWSLMLFSVAFGMLVSSAGRVISEEEGDHPLIPSSIWRCTPCGGKSRLNLKTQSEPWVR